MKKLLFLFLLILHVLFVDAQSDYKPGYVVTPSFDTITGLINNSIYYRNSIVCEFKKSELDSVITYSPNQLLAFRFIDDKLYVSKKVNDKQLFLEFLVEGRLNVYFSKDEQGFNHYYVSKDDSSIKELIYEEGTRLVDGVNMAYQNKKYVGLLNYYTRDCSAMRDKIPDIEEPTHLKMIAFAKEYHDMVCPEQKCIIYKKKMTSQWKAGFNAGIGNQSYNGGFAVFMQQPSVSERVFVGLGFECMYVPGFYNGVLYRLPLSLYYFHSKLGFSPMCGFELDLNRFTATQAYVAGLKYQFKNTAIMLTGEINTGDLIFYYTSSINLGLLVNLNNN